MPYLHEQYQLLLKIMRRREHKRAKAGKKDARGHDALDPNELEYKWAFHACAAEVVDNIICSGFNRSCECDRTGLGWRQIVLAGGDWGVHAL